MVVIIYCPQLDKCISESFITAKMKMLAGVMLSAKQLARSSNEREQFFTTYEKEQKRRSKSALMVELEKG